MCIPLTPVLYVLTTVIIEVYSQCFTESVSLRDIGKSTSRAEISSPSSLYFEAVKGAHIGSALVFGKKNIRTGLSNPVFVKQINFSKCFLKAEHLLVVLIKTAFVKGFAEEANKKKNIKGLMVLLLLKRNMI